MILLLLSLNQENIFVGICGGVLKNTVFLAGGIYILFRNVFRFATFGNFLEVNGKVE